MNKYFEEIIEAYKNYAAKQFSNPENIITWAAMRYDVGEDDKMMSDFINYVSNHE